MAKLKILKEGETDINSSDIWRFSVHSDYPTQQIYTSDHTTITIPAGEVFGNTTVAHSLGYSPDVSAIFEVYGSRYKKVHGHVGALRPGDGDGQFYYLIVSDTEIIFGVDAIITTVPAPYDITINVYYMIFYDQI